MGSSAANPHTNDNLNELIIHFVRSCPEIWDVRNKHYKDNNVKTKKWAEVAQELNVPDDFAKSRWRSIRDRFMKERKKLATKSGQAAIKLPTWSLMPHLDFLVESAEARETISNFQDPQVIKPPALTAMSQSTQSIPPTQSSSTGNKTIHNELLIEIGDHIESNALLQQNRRELTLLSNTSDESPYPSPGFQPISPSVLTPSESSTSHSISKSTAFSMPISSGQAAKKRKSQSLDPVDKAIINLDKQKRLI